jgi:hypothetical protein
MIQINVMYGNSSVGPDDEERARDAAARVLTDAGTTPAAAYAEFQRQWEALGADDAPAGTCQDYDSLTGLAAVWIEAERAADHALTLGWARPDGASCGISA